MAEVTNDTIPRDRTCVRCIHLCIEPGYPGYSEYTPGEPMRLYCGKDHWNLNDADSSTDGRRMLNSAPSCPDYEETKDTP